MLKPQLFLLVELSVGREFQGSLRNPFDPTSGRAGDPRISGARSGWIPRKLTTVISGLRRPEGESGQNLARIAAHARRSSSGNTRDDRERFCAAGYRHCPCCGAHDEAAEDK